MEHLRAMILSEETKIILSFAQVGTIVALIWAVAKIYFNFKSLQDTQNSKLQDHENKIVKQCDEIEKLKSENNLIKVTQAVLETKLENIEAGIVEIKAILVEKIKG